MNRHFLLKIKQLFVVSLFFVSLLSINTATAQKQLSESEQANVDEARSELEFAISDPSLSQAERILKVERSAKILKEYGQSPAFPDGDIPLKKLMEKNYNQAKKEYLDVNELRRTLGGKLLNDQLKIINTMQIDVTEEQIKLLLPGKLACDLSKDLVSTVFNWNIKEGINSGQMGDAAELKNRFLKLAETKKLTSQIEQLYRDHQLTMGNLHRDLTSVPALQELLRRRYQMAEAGTFVIKGYEGAMAYSNSNAPLKAANIKELKTDSGYKDEFKETKYYFRLVKVEPVKKINNPNYVTNITATKNSMGADVKPPKPKEPFSVSASWNEPPAIFYPGDVIVITAKGSGDVRLRIEASNDRSMLCQGVRETSGTSSIVNFKWKANAYGYFNIEVNALVTGNGWGWTSTFYQYETVIIEQ